MKKIIIIGLLSIIVGCSGLKTMPIDPATLPTLDNKTLSLVIHESPDFMAITPDKNLFTKAGFTAAYVEGNQLVQENGIHDPADKICKMMAEVISSDHQFIYNENSMRKSKSKKIKELVRLANRRDYLLDIETVYWAFSYQISNPADYSVKYSVKARLIDVDRKTSIGKSSCDYDTINSGNPPVSYEKLMENESAYIKQAFDDASAFCVNKFKSELF